MLDDELVQLNVPVLPDVLLLLLLPDASLLEDDSLLLDELLFGRAPLDDDDKLLDDELHCSSPSTLTFSLEI